jgi:hypothetical protein
MSLLALIAAAAVQAQAPAPPPQAAPAPLSFAPFTVEVNVAFERNREVGDCSVTAHGTPDAHWIDDACRNIGNSAFLALHGAPADAAGRMTFLLSLEAAGRVAGPAATPQGQVTFRTEARFAVTPAGAVVRCTRGESAGRGARVDLCAVGLPRGNAFAPAAEERAGRLTLTAYTLTAPARVEAP